MDLQALINTTCGHCGAAGQISRVLKSEVETIRGRDYEVQKVVRRCASCSLEFENTQDEDWRPGAYARYRADMGMVTPEEMVAFRKEYALRQDEVAALLGWGEATLGRYERGSLQSAAHDKSLAALMAPGGLADALENMVDVLPPQRRVELMQAWRVRERLLAPSEILAIRRQSSLSPDEADNLVQAKGRWAAWESGDGLQSASADRLIRLMAERPETVAALRRMASDRHADATAISSNTTSPLKIHHPEVKRFREELSDVGLRDDAVRKLLPDWWNSPSEAKHGMFASRTFVASRLGMLMGTDGRLRPSMLPEARFKATSGTTPDEMRPARAVATAVARLVARATATTWNGELPDAASFRQQLIGLPGRKWVDFEGLADAAWNAGIPVVFMPQPPVCGKKMDGMATYVEGRPVIVLCRNQKLSDWMLFVLAHELGHIAHGHLPMNDGAAIMDEMVREEGLETDAQGVRPTDSDEVEANEFAQHLLVSDGEPLAITDAIPKAPSLAREAIAFGEAHQISPGHVVLNAVRHTPSPPFDLNRLGTAATKLVDEILGRQPTQDICKMLTRKHLVFSKLGPDDSLFLEKLGVL